MSRETSNQDAEKPGAASGAGPIEGEEKGAPVFCPDTDSEKEDAVSHHSRDDEDEDETPVDEHEEDEAPVAPVRSRASSTRSRALSIVPRTSRRGWLGGFAVVPEVDRPYDYSNKTKWTITSVVALAGAVAPMGSAIFYRANPLWYAAHENSS